MTAPLDVWDPPRGGRVPIGIVHRSRVKSWSGTGNTWIVTLDAAGNWRCTCPDHQYRGGDCKHIRHERLHYALWRRTPLAALL